MATKEALADVTPAADTVLDFLGIGFGPSNLALAVAAHEIDPSRRGLFFDPAGNRMGLVEMVGDKPKIP